MRKPVIVKFLQLRTIAYIDLPDSNFDGKERIYKTCLYGLGHNEDGKIFKNVNKQ